MFTRYPTDLPRFAAVLVALSFLAWGFSSLKAEEAIGRPSSTAGLAYVFIPAWAAMLAFGGFIVGLVLRALLPPATAKASRAGRAGAGLILVAIPMLAGRHGFEAVRKGEEDARPRTLISTPRVDRQVVQSASRPVTCRPAELIWQSGASPSPGPLPSALPTTTVDGPSVSFEFRGLRSGSIELPALDYVTSAYLLRLEREEETPAYVTLINGRATGRRSVLAVLSPDLRVLHMELMERSWQLADNPLCAESPTNESALSATAMLTCAGYRWCGDDSGIRLRLIE